MHLFDGYERLDERGWRIWYGEIARLLKPGGKGYIAPFDRTSRYEAMEMLTILEQMRKSRLVDYEVDDPDEHSRDETWRGITKVVIKKNKKAL